MLVLGRHPAHARFVSRPRPRLLSPRKVPTLGVLSLQPSFAVVGPRHIRCRLLSSFSLTWGVSTVAAAAIAIARQMISPPVSSSLPLFTLPATGALPLFCSLPTFPTTRAVVTAGPGGLWRVLPPLRMAAAPSDYVNVPLCRYAIITASTSGIVLLLLLLRCQAV